MGSLTYIAPERLRTEPPDQRSDLYAIGVILHEMLTGQPPFSGGDDFTLIEQHLHQEPPRLRDVDASLPASLELIIARALRKHQHERFASADEMANAIEAVAQELA